MLLLAALLAPALAPPITAESLLREMTDRTAVARLPAPPYSSAQASSYDRASFSPAHPSWFANADAGHFVRVESHALPSGQSRREHVLAELTGPGAVVRIWSANPKGTLRVYIDGQAEPAIEAPMTDLLGGSGPVPAPLSQERSRGWNLYAPIPYAASCKITSDEGGFYYHVNYRSYPPGTDVRSLALGDLARLRPAFDAAGRALSAPLNDSLPAVAPTSIAPGESSLIFSAPGPAAVTRLVLHLDAPDLTRALRSTILIADFDNQPCIWAPLGDFAGSGVGLNPFRDWYRAVHANGALESRWVMPFRHTARLRILNLGDQPVSVRAAATLSPWNWDDRSLHFHAAWRAQFPIHAMGAQGTRDWSYLSARGSGVYVGDSLAVMNPVPEWWGEGDEKIRVDAEPFPSHFGTGTEDYYGYAWCSNVPFHAPFHAQPRCDGHSHGSNWGHTTVSRVRSLDAIPFASAIDVDMEIWHWKECDVAYAATTYFYARPGVAVSPEPDEASARAGIPAPPPLPPPFKLGDAIECEELTILAAAPGVAAGPQDMRGFKRGAWSNESHLWVRAARVGDFVELAIPATDDRPRRLILHATRSWDYAIVAFSVNGLPASDPIDLFSGQRGLATPSGPIDLGVHAPRERRWILRAVVSGHNPASLDSRSYFGLDCVVPVAP